MSDSKKKTITTIILAIVMLVCVVIDGWFLYVKFYAPQKMVENSYKVGLQELEDGTTKSFIEVKYHTNENVNGYEAFEIKFNYMMDENREDFYSQGLQFVTDKKTGDIKWGYYLDEGAHYVSWSEGNFWNFTNKVTYYGYFGSYDVQEGISTYNYASGDDYKNTSFATKPINDLTTFKVQLGDDLFQMKFKGETTKYYSDNNLYGSEFTGANFAGNRVYDNYYFYNNVYAFAYKLYNSMGGVKLGKQSSMVFEFGDLFNYYKYDAESGQYSDTAVEDSTKVQALMKSYYSILVYKTADGIRRASDSLFNCVHGSSSFNISGESITDDYFIGRTVLQCDIFNFNIVDMGKGMCAIKLAEEFVNEFESKAEKIYLSICINKDILKQKNYTDFVFATDSGLDKFIVFEAYSIETVNGSTVRMEVSV